MDRAKRRRRWTNWIRIIIDYVANGGTNSIINLNDQNDEKKDIEESIHTEEGNDLSQVDPDWEHNMPMIYYGAYNKK